MTELGVNGYFRKPSEYAAFMKLGDVVKALLAGGISEAESSFYATAWRSTPDDCARSTLGFFPLARISMELIFKSMPCWLCTSATVIYTQ